MKKSVFLKPSCWSLCCLYVRTMPKSEKMPDPSWRYPIFIDRYLRRSSSYTRTDGPNIYIYIYVCVYMYICKNVYTICICITCIIYIYINQIECSYFRNLRFPSAFPQKFVNVKIGKPDVWPPHRSVPLAQLLGIPPEGGVPIRCRNAAFFARDQVMHHGKCEGPPTESAPPRNTRYPETGNVWSDWGRIVDQDTGFLRACYVRGFVFWDTPISSSL